MTGSLVCSEAVVMGVRKAAEASRLYPQRNRVVSLQQVVDQ